MPPRERESQYHGGLNPARIRVREIAAAFTHTRFQFRLRSPLNGATDQESSYRAIEGLVTTCAELVDDGDFLAVGHLLADATFVAGVGR
jgi:hypothetical protein